MKNTFTIYFRACITPSITPPVIPLRALSALTYSTGPSLPPCPLQTLLNMAAGGDTPLLLLRTFQWCQLLPRMAHQDLHNLPDHLSDTLSSSSLLHLLHSSHPGLSGVP